MSSPANKLSRTLVLMATILVSGILHQQLVSCEPDSSAQGGGNQLSSGQVGGQFGSPKRQYLIAPRVGRSPGGPQAIWSALEEAAYQAPGQVQPQRPFPAPLRASLFYLIGNRRMIGPRSGGLLPQARIGRRAAPIGLMPQPRVGRRSVASSDPSQLITSLAGDSSLLSEQQQLELADEAAAAGSGQQEVPVASMSDTSPINEALESLMSGICALAAEADRVGSGSDANIDRPAHRTTSFVPRLGKREPQVMVADNWISNLRQQAAQQSSSNRILCAHYGINCNSNQQLADNLAAEYLAENRNGATTGSQLLALLSSLAQGIATQEGNLRLNQQQGGEMLDQLSLPEVVAAQQQMMQVKRETRAPEESPGEMFSASGSRDGIKRVAFTPRIGK